VRRYFSLHRGEFDTDCIESGFPYCGKASVRFRRFKSESEWSPFDLFKGRGEGCWVPRGDAILNNLSADLLAAADLLNGQSASSLVSGMPGGIGIESGKVWVALLDGGVGVELHVSEHERTNRVSGSQRTTIRGPLAYRVLLEFLGFDYSPRKLYCESKSPSREEVREAIERLKSPDALPA
jgi:hypothetical protein